MMVSSLLWVVEFIIIIIIIRERIKAHEGQNWTTIFVFFSKDFFFSTYKKKKKNGDQFKRKFERPRFRSHRYKGTSKRTVKRARCRTGARTGLSPHRWWFPSSHFPSSRLWVKAPLHHHRSGDSSAQERRQSPCDNSLSLSLFHREQEREKSFRRKSTTTTSKSLR